MLIEILVKDNKQIFSLNSSELSAYSFEKEVLLQDGVEYKVVGCDPKVYQLELSDMTIEKSYTEVTLVKEGDKYSSMNCFVRFLKLFVQ